MELEVKHGSFIEIPHEILVEIDTLNREKGISLTSLARRNNISYTTLQRRLKKLREAGKVVRTSNEIFKSIVAAENEEFRLRRLKMMRTYNDIRRRFKVGQRISISHRRIIGDGQMYPLVGKVEVKGIYDRFIVVHKQGAMGIIKECISYGDILTGYVMIG